METHNTNNEAEVTRYEADAIVLTDAEVAAAEEAAKTGEFGALDKAAGDPEHQARIKKMSELAKAMLTGDLTEEQQAILRAQRAAESAAFHTAHQPVQKDAAWEAMVNSLPGESVVGEGQSRGVTNALETALKMSDAIKANPYLGVREPKKTDEQRKAS